MTTTGWSTGRVALVAGAATLVLAAGSTVALAEMTGTGRPAPWSSAAGSCTVPSLPGTTVDVRLADMSPAMMRGGMMGGPAGSRRTWPAGMMRVELPAGAVRHGVISLRVANVGVMRHELVVLPLSAGQLPGSRAADAGGTVDESSSLGEASRDCGAGAGEGISSGGDGWVTLTLRPGRYEFVCNLPGHYTAGMFAELDVT